eukprot:RCo005304
MSFRGVSPPASGSTSETPRPPTPGRNMESTASRQQLEAALQLLHEYGEKNLAFDDKDTDRERALSVSSSVSGSTSGGASGAAAAVAAAKKRAAGVSGRGVGAGGSQGGVLDKKLKEMQRRVFVSETIMKKLHSKNKALQREIQALRDQITAAGGVPV